MSPRTKEKSAQVREQSRKQIVEAAFRCFAKDGFNLTSMAVIAKEAEVSKGLIYHHFASKEDVLLAVFNNLVEETQGIWQMNLEETSPKVLLSSMIDLTVQFMESHPGWVRLMIHLVLQEDVVEGLSEHIEMLRQAKVFQVKPIFEALGYQDPIAAAFYFGAKLDGITMGYLSLKEDYPIDDMVQKLKAEYNLIDSET